MDIERNNVMRLDGGFTFDFGTMLGKERISSAELEQLAPRARAAAAAIDEMRASGYAKAHLSKDGAPEPVYFTRLPYVAENNPNTPESMQKLAELAAYIKREVDGVVFLGVGGSYLGNKVIFDLFCGEGWNSLTSEERGGQPYIFFSGNNLDPHQSCNLVRQIRSLAQNAAVKGSRFKLLLVPISKSGTTLETLTAFSYFYEKAAASRLVDIDVAVVTDLRPEANSPLYRLALENGWRCFDVKNGVGGRFSVLHDPGLVTAAAAGLDIERLLAGARAMDEACKSRDYRENPALYNACLKYLAAAKHECDIEVLMGYGMCLKSASEWYVQLLAESLGKRRDRDGNIVFYGRTPIAAVGSTDMHAQTQQHQDGRRNKVVQFLHVKNFGCDVKLGNPFPHIADFAKYDGLSLHRALEVAMAANREALDDDGRFSAVYELENKDEFCLGQLFYFLMLSVAYEGELANVDAFDQPGVEAYKRIIKRELLK